MAWLFSRPKCLKNGMKPCGNGDGPRADCRAVTAGVPLVLQKGARYFSPHHLPMVLVMLHQHRASLSRYWVWKCHHSLSLIFTLLEQSSMPLLIVIWFLSSTRWAGPEKNAILNCFDTVDPLLCISCWPPCELLLAFKYDHYYRNFMSRISFSFHFPISTCSARAFRTMLQPPHFIED